MNHLPQKIARRHLRRKRTAFTPPSALKRRQKRASDPIEALKEHLNPENDAERGKDVLDNLPREATEWLLGEGDEWLDEFAEKTDLDLNRDNLQREVRELIMDRHFVGWEMPDAFFEDFWRWVEDTNQLFHEENAPTWYTMTYKHDVDPDTWLIHMTDNAYDIADDGFTEGVSDPSQLAYSNSTGTSRGQAGYNFAFPASYFSLGGSRSRYGDEFVLFQPGPTGGISAQHYGDREDQVIFWGPNATNRAGFSKTKWEEGYRPAGGVVKNKGVESPFQTVDEALEWTIGVIEGRDEAAGRPIR